jgi:hypothetical protein
MIALQAVQRIADRNRLSAQRMSRISFFFSYASQDHRAAWRDGMEQRFNLVDRFFDHLRDIVAGRLGLPQAEVAFRDTARLEVGEIWPDALTEGLQQTDTLIALISPNYLRSRNCGREFQFILDRFGLLREERKTDAHTHRIIPVYWESPLDLNFGLVRGICGCFGPLLAL